MAQGAVSRRAVPAGSEATAGGPHSWLPPSFPAGAALSWEQNPPSPKPLAGGSRRAVRVLRALPSAAGFLSSQCLFCCLSFLPWFSIALLFPRCLLPAGPWESTPTSWLRLHLLSLCGRSCSHWSCSTLLASFCQVSHLPLPSFSGRWLSPPPPRTTEPPYPAGSLSFRLQPPPFFSAPNSPRAPRRRNHSGR